MQKTPRLAGLMIKLLIKINNLGLGGGGVSLWPGCLSLLTGKFTGYFNKIES